MKAFPYRNEVKCKLQLLPFSSATMRTHKITFYVVLSLHSEWMKDPKCWKWIYLKCKAGFSFHFIFFSSSKKFVHGKRKKNWKKIYSPENSWLHVLFIWNLRWLFVIVWILCSRKLYKIHHLKDRDRGRERERANVRPCELLRAIVRVSIVCN